MQDKREKGPRKPRDRIITDEAFDYYFEKSGLIPSLDGPGNTIVKSDSFINESLHRDLNRACYTLWKDQEGNVDWHPPSNDMVQNLVHPSMHNFVYDRSPFIQEEVVGVSNALDFMGEGKPVPGQSPVVRQNEFEPEFRIGSGKVGSETIERLVDKAVPAWDHCLREVNRYGEGTFAGRNMSRFEWIPEASDENDDLWTPEYDLEEFLHKDVELSHQELSDLEEECYHGSENPVEYDQDENDRRMNEGLPPLTPNIDDETMAGANGSKPAGEV
ncbi:hypothetical protein FACUT_7083 [Fusarium acutatum]|uniref:DUF4246 domain-containing protein n=1 Tax=Fusarium acutatum TaxID=78861 RepID=A0A8H4JQC6_9HYPO|nr:hypothetical protein FACUT_7083 [Fusarium acutatum]